MFDECLHVEEQHVEQGFEEGVEQGRILGRDEGRILGLEKGFDIGYEVGMYMGCVLVIKSQRMDVVNRNTARDSKMYRHVDALLSYIDGGAATMWWDPHNEGLQEYMNAVRSKFKVIMAMVSPEQRTCIESMLAGTGAPSLSRESHVADLISHDSTNDTMNVHRMDF